MKEPLERNHARKLIIQICRHGVVIPTRHLKLRLAQRGMTMVDVINVLEKGRMTKAPEPKNDGWTYSVETDRMTVVVAFASETKLLIVTAWRNES